MRVFFRSSARLPMRAPLARRGFTAGAARPWNVARQMLEAEKVEEAHALVREEIVRELKTFQSSRSWGLPLLLLELSKSFLKQNEAMDALKALEHGVALFEDYFAAGLTEEEGMEVHARYVEALLHLAKLLFVSGQGQPDHLWKKAISHAMKHEGRNSYHTLVATLGLAESSLEQLRLEEADRYTAAAAELATLLPSTRATRERLVEAKTMQGLARAQRQDADGAIRFYLEALKHIEAIESEHGELDPWTRTAFHNLYRNIEHAFKSQSNDEEAKGEKEGFVCRLFR